VPKAATRGSRVVSGSTSTRPRKRLTAEERKTSIKAAARRAFTETGDMTGTTIKVIAARSGISEGVIYRHFESKDQLFFEAVVEPLEQAIDSLVAATHVGTAAQQRETMDGLYRQLIATLEETLPLLGLVLFGDPQVATRFYREHLAVAMDRLAAAWGEVSEGHGPSLPAASISARAVTGMALMMALDSHHAQAFDRDRVVTQLSEGTVSGFFPEPPGPSRS
jgi:AcrR family transcriptional regulator